MGSGAGVVVEIDAGSRSRVVDERDAPRIQDAVRAVLEAPRYRERAQTIAAAMAGVPSADEVLDALLGS